MHAALRGFTADACMIRKEFSTRSVSRLLAFWRCTARFAPPSEPDSPHPISCGAYMIPHERIMETAALSGNGRATMIVDAELHFLPLCPTLTFDVEVLVLTTLLDDPMMGDMDAGLWVWVYGGW